MKRAGPLRRRTPLRSRKTIKPVAVSWNERAGTAPRNSAGGRLFSLPRMGRRRKKPGSDPAYLARVRLLPCCARRLSGCTGPVDAHHAGGLVHGRGTGLKPPDRTCIALCRGHHDALHDGRYPFSARSAWPKERRRRWQDEQIARTQKELEAPPFCPDRDREDEAAEAWSVGEVQVHDW